MFNDDFQSSEERAAAMCAKLYATDKAHGSLGTFYAMYPENAPRQYQCPPPPHARTNAVIADADRSQLSTLCRKLRLGSLIDSTAAASHPAGAP